ncbi:MAG: NAD-dependent epimerase [bacterium]|jgi:UDP-glucuronate 4-epimerase|nr:NAD-dependent epimerase [Betaproteobacteria bacterium]
MKILLTGCAGFIGMHTCERLLARGDEVIGVDNLNDYYDPALKQARLDRLLSHPAFRFHRLDISDAGALDEVFAAYRPQRVVNLAAQAGVRYSLKNPQAYVTSNLTGFVNVLEACRHHAVEHLVYASSSSVYGHNADLPFRVEQDVDHPVSLYAATKKSNELMAHCYSHLFRLPTTGLRFFTVYGPWGRPDMALWLFTRAILDGRPIDVFNEGRMRRDFTYIDDIVEGVVRVVDRVATPDAGYDRRVPNAAVSDAPYRLYNIGNQSPVQLLDFIAAIEDALGRKAVRNLLPMQPGDVEATFADVSALDAAVGFKPCTPIDTGVRRFVEWYLGWTAR